jgi:hypothetical protein
MVQSHDRGRGASNCDARVVSASEIARLAFCERQIRLDVLRGRRTSEHQRAARQRGNAAHLSFYEESRRLAERSAKRGRCFIATLALGESPETLALRQFRDLYLRRTLWGRAFIGAYYRLSPIACDMLAASPRLLTVTRWPLQLLAAAAGVAVRMRLRGDPGHGA